MSFDIKPIKTEKDYKDALQLLEQIFDAEKDSEKGNKLEILSILIENYEKKYHPIESPDPIEAIKYRMNELGIKNSDLGKIIGYNSRSSEILNRKRKLTISMIRKISKYLEIPAQVLIQEY